MSWRIQFSQHGPAEVLQWQEQPDTPLAADAVRVRLQAIGVNFIDCYYRGGLYPVASLPSGLGSEGAGVIEAVGSAVQGWQVGERVAYATAPLGAYAEYQDVPPGCLLRLPEQISCEQAAAGLLKGLSVQYLLRQTYPVQAGQYLLWHAAAGGVGLLACQWARALGARLIGVVSSPAKAALALQHGAWAVIDRSCEDVRERVLELTDGQKCPVVYDSVGQASWSTSLDCLQPRGLLVSFGNASGPVEGVNLGLLAQKGSLYVTRPSLFHYANSPTALQQMADELFGLVASGQLHLQASQRLALRDAAQAHRLLQSGQSSGSLVLLP